MLLYQPCYLHLVHLRFALTLNLLSLFFLFSLSLLFSSSFSSLLEIYFPCVNAYLLSPLAFYPSLSFLSLFSSAPSTLSGFLDPPPRIQVGVSTCRTLFSPFVDCPSSVLPPFLPLPS